MPNGSFQQRPDSGTLFINQPSDPKYPVMKGKALLSPTLVSALVAQLQAGLPAEIEIAGWYNEGAKGPYYSIKVGPPYQAQGANGPGPRRAAVPPQRQGAYPAATNAGPFRQPQQQQRNAGPQPPQGWETLPSDEETPF